MQRLSIRPESGDPAFDGIGAVNGANRPVWEDALSYLETATEMGLVMAESN